jgi:hypothetical protein
MIFTDTDTAKSFESTTPAGRYTVRYRIFQNLSLSTGADKGTALRVSLYMTVIGRKRTGNTYKRARAAFVQYNSINLITRSRTGR